MKNSRLGFRLWIICWEGEKMICAYCGKEAKGTKEHIISSGILGLFPECFATIDGERNVVHQGDPMVKDVCADCNNNRISYIDSYAINIVEKYFLKKYSKDESLAFEYDYALIQKMCLKYAFNDLRSRKKDISFFDDTIKNYILSEENNTPLRHVTVLAGLAVNTSPMPDFTFGNLKLRWSDSPVFLANSIVVNVDCDTGKITMRENMEHEEFKNLAVSYVFRFNSVQFLMLCWENAITDEQLHMNEVVLEHQYPYQILNATGHSKLERCTSEATYHQEKIIDVSWGQSLMDEISMMRGTFSDRYQQYLSDVEEKWNEEEKSLAEKHRR